MPKHFLAWQPGWRTVAFGLILGLPLLFPFAVATAANTAGVTMLYWCDGRSGRELQVKPGPGCQPLVEEKKEDTKDMRGGKKPSKEFPTVPPERLESAITAYMKDYNEFLSCCTSEPTSEQIDDLEERASDLIRQTAEALSVASIYMSRNQALIVPVARARDKLRSLKAKHQRITDTKGSLEQLDYEQAGRERRRVQDMEESIGREFAPTRAPSRAATGADIGRSGPTGPSVGTSGPTGPSIGTNAPTGTAIGIQPPTLGELVDTPPGMDRNRENSLTTTKPVSGGRVGADVGDSSFNEGARTGPALGDSSLNR